ncbi:Predicted arabinose efflux permease, MFS family [Streptomyces sp. DI166]|uniref:MFS transporter n=1 Tax=Streptomyces sp. DI166 TaxID=1839783 RepID=UPI0007F462D3|nr:MFS transporter [Streptomyces sp. DI166]SBT94541.1 Predicted arabinose efflux permease, MFS family [Streptomyces sp. DI166]
MTTKWTLLRVARDRTAALCLTGVVVSGFGTSALWLVSGVWVKDLTGSDGLAALCLVAMWAPTLAGPLLGTLADRTRRVPLLIATNALLAALLPALLTVDSPATVWLLFTVLFVYGATGAVQDAAESALVGSVLPADLLGDFNGLRMTANEGVKILAPPAGAALYTLYGGPGVALLDALTFLLAAGVYARLRLREPRPQRPTAGRRTRTAEGACHLWARPVPRLLTLTGGVTMLCAGVNGALVHPVVEALGHSPAYAGVLYAAQGAGSVAVGLISGPTLRRLGAPRFAACGVALFGAAVALRAVPSDAVALACGAAIGAGLPAVLIATLTRIQHETPGPLLGRVTATAQTLVFTPNVLGLAAGAALVEGVDHRLLLGCAGLVPVLAAVPLLQAPANASRTDSRSPSDASPA